MSAVEVERAEGKDGPVYRVLFCGEVRYEAYSRHEAEEVAQWAQFRRATCSACGETDVESFYGQLGSGRLQCCGANGWLLERLLTCGGYRDVAYCPSCRCKR